MNPTKIETGRAAARPLPELAQLREAVLESAGAALFVCDGERRGFPIVQITPAFTGITGYTNETAMGEELSLLYGSRTDARTTKAVNDALRGGRGFQGELLCYRANGRTVWCEVVIAPVGQGGGSGRHFAATLTDISKRQQREARLREQMVKYRSVFEHAVEGIYQSTLGGQYLQVNQALAAMYGYASPEALMEEVYDIENQIYVDAAMREQFRKLIEEADQVRGLEYQVRRRDGRIIWISENARIVRDPNGKPRYYEGFIREITQLKQATEDLRAGEQKFSRLFHSNPVATSVSTMREGRYVDVNAEFLNLLQRTREEVIGHTAGDLNLGLDSVQRAASISNSAAYGTLRHVESEVCTKSGQTRQVLWSGGKAVIGGEDCLVGSILDITERKQAETRMNLLLSALSSAANGIVITNRDGQIEWVNPSFTRMTGYSTAEACGSNPRISKSGRHPQDFYANLWATIVTGKVWHGEMINQRKDGRLYTADTTITPVCGAGAGITHFVAIMHDVTEQRRLEDHLRQAHKLEAIGTLAGGIAHDFNNMLAVMLGYGQLLQQETENLPAAQEYIDEILQAAERAKELVRQILTFSRRHEQKRQVIPLAPVINEAVKFLRASLPADLKIEMWCDPGVPEILADATQIYQVVMNLATNAWQALAGRAGQITLTLDAFQPDQPFLQAQTDFRPVSYARLTVADTGHGMEAATLARIFEPFFTTKPVGKGTGLGLAVVHGIVQSHEGHITVKSQPGCGTTFCLYFPAQSNPAAVSAASPRAAVPGSGQKILLLDDEPALTASFQRLLERLNYQVTTSNHAMEAVKWFSENPPWFDLLITDLTMPELNGLEVARQFHRRHPEVPVILISGFTPELNAEDLHAAGIRELLAKPINLIDLADALHRAFAPSAATACLR